MNNKYISIFSKAKSAWIRNQTSSLNSLIFLKASLFKISNYEIFQTHRKAEINTRVHHLNLMNSNIMLLLFDILKINKH